MKSIELTVRERAELKEAITVVCRGPKDDPRRQDARKVMKVIDFTPEEAALYFISIPGFPKQKNMVAIDRASTSTVVTVEMDREQGRFLLKVMKDGFVNLGWEDDDWLDPLVAKMKVLAEIE